QKQRADSERQRAADVVARSRPTTLLEYITNCHHYLDLNVTIESDKSLTSKGTITNPQNKFVPSTLKPWADFLKQQKSIHGRLYSTYPEDKQVFESTTFLVELGERLARKKVANERDLEYIQHNIVETPVANTVESLRDHEATKQSFALGQGLTFDNHPNALSDGAKEPLQRRTGRDSTQLRPDQVCVYTHDNVDQSRRSLAFVLEYKPPHKLTLWHLRVSLREMDIQQEVVNRPKRPADKDELFSYHADRIVAAAISQMYHYMITGGLTYSYVTTGEAIVFLKIDWKTPEQLLFHLAEPRAEVLAQTENAMHCTAVSQVLAFTLLAIEEQHLNPGQDKRSWVMEELDRWCMDHDAVLKDVPESVRKQTPPPSAYAARDYRLVDRSPYKLRSRPSPQPRRPDANNSTHTQPSTPKRQYCSQECLLGLVRGEILDMACPNVHLHQQGTSQDHPVNSKKLLGLLRKQLAESLDTNIVPLGKQGARGAAFQVTLAKYGYTIIAKGTIAEYVDDLEHEGHVYETLEPLQGKHVPVFLGAFHLKRPYYYDHRVTLVYMMLLSWAGEPINTKHHCSHELMLARRSKAVEAVAQLGVEHGDVRDANTLWCPETKDVMLIDFERSLLLVRAPIILFSPDHPKDLTHHRKRLQSSATNCAVMRRGSGVTKTGRPRGTHCRRAARSQRRSGTGVHRQL
ncbi:hypothetical protein Micbo1qcDRAFT_225014, partial [Microdochium bolleyi]